MSLHPLWWLAFTPQALAPSEMILNYRVIVERYPFSNGVVGGLIPAVTGNFFFFKKKKKN